MFFKISDEIKLGWWFWGTFTAIPFFGKRKLGLKSAGRIDKSELKSIIVVI